MALPSEIVAQFYDQLKLYAGKTGTIQLSSNLDPPATPSYKPLDKISIAGKQATVAPKSANFSGGAGTAVAAVKTITFSGVGVDTESFQINSTTLTFDSTPTTENDIPIAGTAADQASELADIINAHSVLSQVITATVSGAVVTLTSRFAGVDFTITESLAYISTATVTANVTATAATLAITFTGTKHKQGCQDEIMIPMAVNGTVRNIRFIVDRASDSTTNAQRATAMQALLTAGLNDTAWPSGSRIRGLGINDTTEDLKNAMRELFGASAATAFTVSGGTLTLTALTGSAGNNLTATTQVRNSLPSPIATVSASGVVQEPGIVTVGDIGNFNVSAQTNFAEYQPGNDRAKRRIPTTVDLTVTFDLYFNAQPEVLEQASSASGVVYGDDGTIISFNGAAVANLLSGKAVFFVFENDTGGYDYIRIHKALFNALNLDYFIENVTPIQVQGQPQAFGNRPGDPLGFIYQSNA